MDGNEIQLEMRMPDHGLVGQRILVVSCGGNSCETYVENYDGASARLFELIKEALNKTQNAKA